MEVTGPHRLFIGHCDALDAAKSAIDLMYEPYPRCQRCIPTVAQGFLYSPTAYPNTIKASHAANETSRVIS